MKVAKTIVVVLALAGVAAAKHKPRDYPYSIELRSQQHRMVKVDCARNSPGTTGSEASQPCTEVPLPLPFSFLLIDAYEIEAHDPVWAVPKLLVGGPKLALASRPSWLQSVTLGTYRYRLLNGLTGDTIEQVITLQVWRK
jgi:hypothetical protein